MAHGVWLISFCFRVCVAQNIIYVREITYLITEWATVDFILFYWILKLFRFAIMFFVVQLRTWQSGHPIRYLRSVWCALFTLQPSDFPIIQQLATRSQSSGWRACTPDASSRPHDKQDDVARKHAPVYELAEIYLWDGKSILYQCDEAIRDFLF